MLYNLQLSQLTGIKLCKMNVQTLILDKLKIFNMGVTYF